MERYGLGKCFVISEIGAPGSTARAKADRFFMIISKALARVAERTGRVIEPERLDSDRTVDNFMREIVRRILRYELVVAVLSNRNPNAHLELGIALAAGRRVIILVENEEELPSDLKGERRIICDLYAPDHTIAEIAEELSARLGQNEPVVAFGKYNALGKPGHAVRYLNQFLDLQFDEWSRFFWAADRYLTIATTSFNHIGEPDRRWWFSRARLKERHDKGETAKSGQDRTLVEILIQRAVAEGIQVRLMALSPRHPYLEHLVNDADEFDRKSRLQKTRDEIARNVETLATALAGGAAERNRMSAFLDEAYADIEFSTLKSGGSVELVLVERGPLYARTCLSDKGAIVTPYHLVETTNSGGPSFVLANDRLQDANDNDVENNFYRKVAEDMERLYEMNRANTVIIPSEQIKANMRRSAG